MMILTNFGLGPISLLLLGFVSLDSHQLWDPRTRFSVNFSNSILFDFFNELIVLNKNLIGNLKNHKISNNYPSKNH